MSSGTSTKAVSPEREFSVSHFFVLLSLLAATVAVVVARPSAPENLILISLTVGAAGVAAVCVYRMLAPLVAPEREGERGPISSGRLRENLEREKALTLRSIKELEFDRAMGKLSQQDFDQMAHRLRARAIGIMKQLDAGVYRAQIEWELARRTSDGTHGAQRAATLEAGRPRSERSPSATGAAGAPETAGPGAPTRVARPASGCSCGSAYDADARFCKQCGRRLVSA